MLLPLKLQNRILQPVNFLGILQRRFYDPFVGGAFDLPPMVPSIVFGPDCFNEYRYNAYTRPLRVYRLLMETVGQERFLAALQEYIRRWRGKHPTPYDFFFAFNEVLGEFELVPAAVVHRIYRARSGHRQCAKRRRPAADHHDQ